jgi:hypothetical protein
MNFNDQVEFFLNFIYLSLTTTTKSSIPNDVKLSGFGISRVKGTVKYVTIIQNSHHPGILIDLQNLVFHKYISLFLDNNN